MYDFFFSSRRRHTRFSRDWSSDVCSSDLNTPTPRQPREAVQTAERPGSSRQAPRRHHHHMPSRQEQGCYYCQPRSEERRVGKEGRARWAREQQKKQAEEEHIGGETATGTD